MFEYLKNIKERVWAFFDNSGTIVVARLTALLGFITAAFASMDWSLLYTLVGEPAGFSKMQALWLGGALAVKGVLDEIVRRSNTKKVDNVLISKSTEEVAIKAVKKPGKLKKV